VKLLEKQAEWVDKESVLEYGHGKQQYEGGGLKW